MPQLREFIYIDNESLNSNLSSLGQGIPSEITQSSENQTEKGGKGGGRFAGIGGDARYIKMDKDQVETTLDITAPYRFQELLDEIDNNDIEIKKNPDPRSLSRSDLVMVNGEVHPMAMLKIAMALDAFGQFANEDFNTALKTLGETPMPQSDLDEFGAVSTVLDAISGNEYPVRIERDDITYCTALDQDHIRQSVFDAFGESERYTIFGRVKRHIPGNEDWNPVHALEIMQQYMPEEGTGQEFMKEIRKSVEDFNISINDKDMRVKGHTAVIEPIAMYW